MEKRENHIWMVGWKSDQEDNRQTITVHNASSKQPLALLTNAEPNSSSLITALEVALQSGGAPFKTAV